MDDASGAPARLGPDNSGPGAFPANKGRATDRGFNDRAADRTGADRGFVRPQDDGPLPPAPNTGLPRSPTPAGPSRQEPQRPDPPEPPISGPLSPVRQEEPGKLAKNVLAEALNPPPGQSLHGQSISLFDALSRSSGRVARAEVAKAYWTTSAAMADYCIWLDAQQRLKQLSEGARYGNGGGSELSAALASAQAQLREAELVAAETRHRLASYLGDPQLEPICSDSPHVGGYRTEFERLFANKQAPTHLHLIHRTLPLRQRAIELRAEAVRSAREALDAATGAFARGQAEGRDVLLQLDLYRGARQSFVHEVEQYNGQIADYAVGIAGEGGELRNFVPLLIRTAEGSSILRPTPQPATAPSVVPPGSALPPAPNSADAGERSILRSRTRIADGRRDEAVRPAVTEEPIERTFAEPALRGEPPPGEPLRKVDAWDEPELQPVESRPASAEIHPNASPSKPTAKTPATSKEPWPPATPPSAKEAAPTTGDQPAVKRVALRPFSHDAESPLADVARLPSEQWVAALAERLHDMPINPLENNVVPTQLRDCLRQVQTPAERRAVIGAFWSARERAARYQAAATRGRQLDALSQAGPPRGVAGGATRPLSALVYSTLRAIAEADEESARVALSAACYELTVAARQPASGPWLWPGTRPPAERLALLDPPPASTPASAAASQAAVTQRHLERIIAGSYALLNERATAVLKADAARLDVSGRSTGREGLAAPFQWIERQHDETLRFLGALTRYHLAYADYTLSHTPANTGPEALAQRLLASERLLK